MAWLVLSNKMDVCYLLVYVQEIRIQPYFCVKQGHYFFPLFAKDPVWMKSSRPSFKVTECIFTLLTKLKVTIVILLVAHPEGVGMQHETPCWGFMSPKKELCCFMKSLFAYLNSYFNMEPLIIVSKPQGMW